MVLVFPRQKMTGLQFAAFTLADFAPDQIRTMLRTSVVGPVSGRTVEQPTADSHAA